MSGGEHYSWQKENVEADIDIQHVVFEFTDSRIQTLCALDYSYIAFHVCDWISVNFPGFVCFIEPTSCYVVKTDFQFTLPPMFWLYRSMPPRWIITSLSILGNRGVICLMFWILLFSFNTDYSHSRLQIINFVLCKRHIWKIALYK